VEEAIPYRSTGLEGLGRSGLVGAVKYFLFRRVPSTEWMQTLGSGR